jgi:hypothetical protein
MGTFGRRVRPRHPSGSPWTGATASTVVLPSQLNNSRRTFLLRGRAPPVLLLAVRSTRPRTVAARPLDPRVVAATLAGERDLGGCSAHHDAAWGVMAAVMALLVGLRACLRYRQAALLLVVLCPPVAWWAWLGVDGWCRVSGVPVARLACYRHGGGPPPVVAALFMFARCVMYHAGRRGVPRCVMAVVMARLLARSCFRYRQAARFLRPSCCPRRYGTVPRSGVDG